MQIISHCRNGELQWVDSTVLRFEINEISDLKKRSVVNSLLNSMPRVTFVSVNTAEILRGKQFESLGFKERDASHLACAESGKADIFLTTDDRVIRRVRHLGSQLRVQVDNPNTWLQKHTIAGGN
jgi:predicted nucleic acid-binding protein